MRILFCLLCLAFAGCRTAGRIKSKLATVTAVPDAGKPATLHSDVIIASLPIPAGSNVTVTKTEATPTEPAKEVTRVEVSEATEWKKTETKVQADTGTVDTSVAKHRIDAAETRYLLFASMGAAILAGLFIYIKYPTPALMCGAASVIFFLAWKLADLPSWFWVVGVSAISGGVLLWRGYERREAEEKKHAEELAKAKAIAVPVAPPIPVVVTNQPTPST
jgi:hypothetical protein